MNLSSLFPDPDPLAEYVQQLRAVGWSLVPQAGAGEVEHGLLRTRPNGFDLLTLPWIGLATVVSVTGLFDPARPRDVGTERWRHQARPDAAITWALATDENQAGFLGDDQILIDIISDEGTGSHHG